MEYADLRRSLSEKRENLHVEYKQEISDRFKFAKSIASMANSGGGVIYVGVKEGERDKPIIVGVKHDTHVHNKDRIVNVINDRIRPQIPGLEVEVVQVRSKQTFVFVITIPSTIYVHGLKDNGHWMYYARKPGRVDELDPSELAELSAIKRSYRDNMKCRAALLSTVKVTKSEIARCLELAPDELNNCYDDKEKFRNLILNAQMKNVSTNLLDSFYDLKRGIRYSLDLPHGELTVEEREGLKDIEEVLADYAPDIEEASTLDITDLESPANYVHVSVVGWVKYAVKDIQQSDREEIWSKLIPAFNSYGYTLKDFVESLRETGVPFTEFYEKQFYKYLGQALRHSANTLDGFTSLLESMQLKHGRFEE